MHNCIFENICLQMDKLTFFFLFIIITLVFAPSFSTAQNRTIIQVKNLEFIPKNITINSGDTVQFQWIDGINTIVSQDQITLPAFNLNMMSKSRAYVINRPGILPYYSITHGGPFGSTMSGTITVNSISSIRNSQTLANSLTVFPNPVVNDRLSVQFYVRKESNLSIKLLDILGNEVLVLSNEKRAIGDFRKDFDLAGRASPGMYFVRITCGAETAMKRISIQ